MRERLIREGKIVPATDSMDSQSMHQQVYESIKKLTELFEEDFLKKIREKFIRDNYLKALEYFNYADESELSDSGRKVVINYYFALSVKHLKIIDSTLNSFGKFLSSRVSILRSGFFFAFKENMKNTP